MLTNAELAIISLLAEAPRHGYAIEQAVEQRGMRQWTEIGFSSIYFLLNKLEKKGLIEKSSTRQSSPKSAKPYQLTSDGYKLYHSEVFRNISEPSHYCSSLSIGLANLPELSLNEALDAINMRIEAISAHIKAIREQERLQSHLPEFVQYLFDYSKNMMNSEMKWIKEMKKKLGSQEPKIDLKKVRKFAFSAPKDKFIQITIPETKYFMVDGSGNPNVSIEWKESVEALYTSAYTLKFISKNRDGKDYVVPPLEGLWWSDDFSDFLEGRKDKWSWTMMIMIPDFIDSETAELAIQEAKTKKNNTRISDVRFEILKEESVVQILHIGPYDEEGPVIKRMHETYIPNNGLSAIGKHHEIYLSDPRKVEREKNRTILRQPVQKA